MLVKISKCRRRREHLPYNNVYSILIQVNVQVVGLVKIGFHLLYLVIVSPNFCYYTVYAPGTHGVNIGNQVYPRWGECNLRHVSQHGLVVLYIFLDRFLFIVGKLFAKLCPPGIVGRGYDFLEHTFGVLYHLFCHRQPLYFRGW